MHRLAVGEVINERYEVTSLLRDGMLHNYWLARDNVLNRPVTVKILRDHEQLDEIEIDRAEAFKQDTAISARLEHPNILPVYDHGEYRGNLFTITRYLPNSRSLAVWQQQTPLDSLQIVALAQRLATALDFMHEQGVVHGDICPNNVLLDAQCQPYIGNFSVAALRQQMLKSGILRYVGTPGFTAPEVVNGEWKAGAGDHYSFGVLLFYLFARRWPVVASSMIAAEPLSIAPYRSDLPPGVDLVVQRLTRIDPAQRYSTATEAAEALTRAFYSGNGTIEGQIFLSYARKDSEYVYKLAKELQRVGVPIWIDQDIEPGTNWDAAIESALERCDKMLLIVSPASVKSENVQDEWSYFLEEGKAVYPFIYQETSIPFRLRRRQHITGTSDLLNDVARIVELLSGGTPTKLIADEL